LPKKNLPKEALHYARFIYVPEMHGVEHVLSAKKPVDGGYPVVYVELLVDVIYVFAHGFGADKQQFGDFFVGPAPGQQFQDLEFPFG
jgi:hypothetical protein